MSSSDHEERLRQLELAINTLQRNTENHEASAQARVNKMEQIDKAIQTLAMEINGAKAGGRVLIGVWMVLGPVLGMLGVWLKDHFAKMILIGSLVFFSSCAQLTPEQQAELATLRAQNVAAAQKSQELAAELQQARKDFEAGKLTQEKLTDITLRSQEGIEAARKAYEDTKAKMSELQKQGVPPWQALWEGGGREILLIGASLLLAKKEGKGAVQQALAKVREERGPIEARKGSAPKAG